MTIALLLIALYLMLPPQRVLPARYPECGHSDAAQVGGAQQTLTTRWQMTIQRFIQRWQGRILGRRINVRDLLHAAAACDLFAACLRSGLPPGAAAQATSAGCHPDLAPAFESCASRFALATGDVWESLRAVEVLSDVAISAKRVQESGAALAKTLQEAAESYRSQALDAAAATAERAGVSIAAPLALCFLPAFVVLGLIPTIAGLASEMFNGWVS